MSFISILKSELMKYKRSALWKGVFLIPILSFAMLFADLYIRVDFLMSNDHIKQLAHIGINGRLEALIYENHLSTFWFMLLSLSIVVVAVIVNYTEYSENTWKQIIARPVERRRIYISKWIVVLMAAIILIVLNGVSVIFIKSFFGINGDCTLIFKYKILEICATLGVVSFQQFISCYMKNSLASAAIGFAGSIGAYMFAQSKILSYIIPYANVILAMPLEGNRDAQAAAFFGIASGVLWLVIGIIEFNKRDIK